MLYDLVDSRLDIPTAPPRHVPRPRLLAALDTARDVPLVLLSAGPGTGKTVLLAEWARHTRLRVNTVKTHLAAIYRKLGASGRREAVRRARELELLLTRGWFTRFG